MTLLQVYIADLTWWGGTCSNTSSEQKVWNECLFSDGRVHFDEGWHVLQCVNLYFNNLTFSSAASYSKPKKTWWVTSFMEANTWMLLCFFLSGPVWVRLKLNFKFINRKKNHPQTRMTWLSPCVFHLYFLLFSSQFLLFFPASDGCRVSCQKDFFFFFVLPLFVSTETQAHGASVCTLQSSCFLWSCHPDLAWEQLCSSIFLLSQSSEPQQMSSVS